MCHSFIISSTVLLPTKAEISFFGVGALGTPAWPVVGTLKPVFVLVLAVPGVADFCSDADVCAAVEGKLKRELPPVLEKPAADADAEDAV